MSGNCKPIGFFDSGMGGLSVLKTARRLLPGENYVYFGDNLNAPYGEKSEEEIKKLTLDACGFLYDKGVKAIVIACNTATSAAVIMMREAYNIPVISMEPAVKPALEGRQAGKVLVLATPATVSQARYLGLIERLNAHSEVISVGCGGLVELIEEGHTDEKSIHAYLSERLAFLSGQAIGAVVLGCTHYSFAEAAVKSYIDKTTHTDCPVFDGRHGTARQLQRVLQSQNMLCDGSNEGRIQFFASLPGYDISTFEKIYNDFAV
jgi:glutamate racemase